MAFQDILKNQNFQAGAQMVNGALQSVPSLSSNYNPNLNSEQKSSEAARDAVSNTLLSTGMTTGDPWLILAGVANTAIGKTGGFTDASEGLGKGKDIANKAMSILAPGFGYFTPKTDKYKQSQEVQSMTGGYSLGDDYMKQAQKNADAKLFFGGEFFGDNQANRMIGNARNIDTDITRIGRQAASNRERSNVMATINTAANNVAMQGGTGITRVGKEGLKFAKQITSKYIIGGPITYKNGIYYKQDGTELTQEEINEIQGLRNYTITIPDDSNISNLDNTQIQTDNKNKAQGIQGTITEIGDKFSKAFKNPYAQMGVALGADVLGGILSTKSLYERNGGSLEFARTVYKAKDGYKSRLKFGNFNPIIGDYVKENSIISQDEDLQDEVRKISDSLGNADLNNITIQNISQYLPPSLDIEHIQQVLNQNGVNSENLRRILESEEAREKLVREFISKNPVSTPDGKLHIDMEKSPTSMQQSYKDGGIIEINEDGIVSRNATYYKEGGSFNVIPEGALHKNKHHMENATGLTKKGIPVVTEEDGGLVQQAEIECNEIIFRLEVTNKLEELMKEGTEEAALEAGKLLVKEILHNTHDNTGLIENVKC